MVSNRKVEGVMVSTKGSKSCTGRPIINIFLKTDVKHIKWLDKNIGTNPHYSEHGCTIDGRETTVLIHMLGKDKYEKVMNHSKTS